MPFYITIMGRWKYNVLWFQEMLLPDWILNSNVSTIMNPEWLNEEWEKARNFNFFQWWMTEEASLPVYFADDITRFLRT